VCACVRVGVGALACLLACTLTNQSCNMDAILSSAATLSPPYFSTLSHKRHEFREKSYGAYLQLLFETSVILRTDQRDVIINVETSSCKAPVIFVAFSWNLNFSDIFSKKKNLKYRFIKIRPAGVELFHADGQTDMTKLRVAFRNFANAPKNRLRVRVLVYVTMGSFWNLLRCFCGCQRFGETSCLHLQCEILRRLPDYTAQRPIMA
jgi:hypothetical protein